MSAKMNELDLVSFDLFWQGKRNIGAQRGAFVCCFIHTLSECVAVSCSSVFGFAAN